MRTTHSPEFLEDRVSSSEKYPNSRSPPLTDLEKNSPQGFTPEPEYAKINRNQKGLNGSNGMRGQMISPVAEEISSSLHPSELKQRYQPVMATQTTIQLSCITEREGETNDQLKQRVQEVINGDTGEKISLFEKVPGRYWVVDWARRELVPQRKPGKPKRKKSIGRKSSIQSNASTSSTGSFMGKFLARFKSKESSHIRESIVVAGVHMMEEIHDSNDEITNFNDVSDSAEGRHRTRDIRTSGSKGERENRRLEQRQISTVSNGSRRPRMTKQNEIEEDSFTDEGSFSELSDGDHVNNNTFYRGRDTGVSHPSSPQRSRQEIRQNFYKVANVVSRDSGLPEDPNSSDSLDEKRNIRSNRSMSNRLR